MSRSLEALHFGPNDRLFGLRSEPSVPARKTAIVICQSGGMEALRCYRGLYVFAHQLAERGFEVLRFNYAGSGDSADVDSPSLKRGLEDIVAAVHELRSLAGTDRVVLLGVRLGALLAAQAAAAAGVDQLLAWDAPATGREWVEQMRALHREHYEYKNRVRPAGLRLEIRPDEMLGSFWPPELIEEVNALTLKLDGTLKLRRFVSADVVDTTGDAHRLPDTGQWTEVHRLDAPWVPVASIAAICEILARELP